MKTPILKACPCCDAPLFADGPAQTVTPFCKQIRSGGVLFPVELWWRCDRCGCKWGHGSVATASAPAGEHGHEWQDMERAAAKAYGEPIGMPDPEAAEMDAEDHGDADAKHPLDKVYRCHDCGVRPTCFSFYVDEAIREIRCEECKLVISGAVETKTLVRMWNAAQVARRGATS